MSVRDAEEAGGDGADVDVSAGAADDEMPVIDDFDALVELVAAHDLVFVRYSSGPAKDPARSVDYEADVDPVVAISPLDTL